MHSTKTSSNITHLFRVIGGIDQMTFINCPFLKGIKCKNSIWPNILFEPSFDLKELKVLLPEILKEIKDNRLPPIIMFDPEVDHSDCIQWFKEQGFRHGTWLGMTAKLIKEEKVDGDLKIRETTDLESWLKCIESTLMDNEKLDISIFKELQRNPSIVILEGRMDGIIVSTSIVFIRENNAGLFLVGTEESYRKRGFGKAITIASKNFAFHSGCSEMYLHSTPIGESTYSACGFTEVGIVDVFNLAKRGDS